MNITETPEQRFERRLEQANAIINLFAPDARIEKRTTRYFLTREAPRGDNPQEIWRRQYLISPHKDTSKMANHIQNSIFYGRTYSNALAALVKWVWDIEPRLPMDWWERATHPNVALGRENGDTILACLRETDYSA